MDVAHLLLEGVRNLDAVELDLGPSGNWFGGPNGSGKTSFLEAIYFLATGRSFRSPSPESVIRTGRTDLLIRGRLTAGGIETLIGIRRDRVGNVAARLNGEAIHQASRLAEALRVFVLEPMTIQLVVGSPKQRRQQLDWGLFHVERGFQDAVGRFQRVLRQRNAALRQGNRAEAPWDAPFVEAAVEVDRLRREYFLAWQAVLSEVLTLLRGPPVDFSYRQGWNREESLEESLSHHLERDVRLGTTSVGPHRADVSILFGGQLARECLSRGQCKLVSYAWVLSQILLMARLQTSDEAARPALVEATAPLDPGIRAFSIGPLERRPIVLLDDLLAELDLRAAQAVIDLLNQLGVQYFVTTTLEQPPNWFRSGLDRWFHVEQGVIRLRLE